MGIAPRLKVTPKLVVKTRLKVLHYVLHELLLGMGAEDVTLDIVRKGVVERKIIQEVWMVYLNADDEIVGRITLKIDWDLHRVRAEDEKGKEIKVEEDKPIAEQISKINGILINHTKALRRAYKVVKIESHFIFIPDVAANTKKYEEASKYLGTETSKPLKWATEKALGTKIEFTASGLEELSIKIEHPSKERS